MKSVPHFLLKAGINLLRNRVVAVISLVIIVPVGFYSKFYSGPGAQWANNSLGVILYEIFWCILIFLFLNIGKPWIIASFVFTFTGILEFLQLSHHSLLELVRSSFIDRTLIGNSFTLLDFPYYFLGCVIGWLWISSLQYSCKVSYSLNGTKNAMKINIFISYTKS